MDTSTAAEVVDDDEDDDEFRAAQASALTQTDIIYEMEKRGMKSTGFQDTDIEMLQKAFDEEFRANLEEIRAKRRESKRRAAQQAGMQRRRLIMQETLQEEQNELAGNAYISQIIDTVKEGLTGDTLRVDIGSIAARSFAKAMWSNTTITSLDLSSNGLDDRAGKYIARILNRNNVLLKMELDNNKFGSQTCLAFGESLRKNTSLTYLSLDSNPLMKAKGKDEKEFGEFVGAIATNSVLTSVNLFRCGITTGGGKLLAAALQDNKHLLFCDVAHNPIDLGDLKRIAESLDRNLSNFDLGSRQKAVDDDTAAKKRAAEEKARDDERKAKELAEWLEKRRQERASERRDNHDAEVNRLKEEAEERRLKEEKEAAAKAKAEAEAAEKKAKKAAKKKKK